MMMKRERSRQEKARGLPKRSGLNAVTRVACTLLVALCALQVVDGAHKALGAQIKAIREKYHEATEFCRCGCFISPQAGKWYQNDSAFSSIPKAANGRCPHAKANRILLPLSVKSGDTVRNRRNGRTVMVRSKAPAGYGKTPEGLNFTKWVVCEQRGKTGSLKNPKTYEIESFNLEKIEVPKYRGYRSYFKTRNPQLRVCVKSTGKTCTILKDADQTKWPGQVVVYFDDDCAQVEKIDAEGNLPGLKKYRYPLTSLTLVKARPQPVKDSAVPPPLTSKCRGQVGYVKPKEGSRLTIIEHLKDGRVRVTDGKREYTIRKDELHSKTRRRLGNIARRMEQQRLAHRLMGNQIY